MKSQCCLLLPFLFFTSCATITRGVHEKLSVISDPPGANVQLSTGERGITPAKFVKKRRTENFTVSVSKPGYLPQTVRVLSQFSATGGTAMVGGNFVFGGFVGVGVDAATGAYNSLYPNPVSVRLMPVSKPLKAIPKKSSATSAPQRPRKEKVTAPVSPKAKAKATATPTPTPEPSATPVPTATPAPPPPTAERSPTPEEMPTLESVPNPEPSPSP